jgi:hypothetical protein
MGHEDFGQSIGMLGQDMPRPTAALDPLGPNQHLDPILDQIVSELGLWFSRGSCMVEVFEEN